MLQADCGNSSKSPDRTMSPTRSQPADNAPNGESFDTPRSRNSSNSSAEVDAILGRAADIVAQQNAAGRADLRVVTTCGLCKEPMTKPKVLHCTHSFCLKCLEGLPHDARQIACPLCEHPTMLDQFGIHGLLDDLVAINAMKMNPSNPNEYVAACTACKNNRTATACCLTCKMYLCVGCCQMHTSLQGQGGTVYIMFLFAFWYIMG